MTLMQFKQSDDFNRRWCADGAELAAAQARGAIAILTSTPAPPVGRAARGKPASSPGYWLTDGQSETFVAGSDLRQFLAAGYVLVETCVP
jgi:hypothetical protein